MHRYKILLIQEALCTRGNLSACDHCSGAFGLFAKHKYHKQYKFQGKLKGTQQEAYFVVKTI